MLRFLAGLAIFLFAFELLKEGLNFLSTPSVKRALFKLSSGRLRGLILGTGLTFLFQSSSAMTSMLVGMVDSQLLPLNSALVMSLGSGIGSAITVKIISLEISSAVYVLIVIGFILSIIKEGKSPIYGKIILGAGLIFYGMGVMESSFGIEEHPGSFSSLLLYLRRNYFYLFTAGLILTVILQTSASALGILMALSASSILSPSDCFAFVLGANVGTTSTAFIASLKGGIDGKRLSLGYFLFKLAGAMLFLFFIEEFAELFFPLSGASQKKFVADSNIIFNIVNAILFLPLSSLCSSLTIKLIPERRIERGRMCLKYIDRRFSGNIPVGLAQVHRELMRMCDEVGEMLRKSIEPFQEGEMKTVEAIREMDDCIDFLDENIRRFLIDIAKHPLDSSTVSRVSAMIRISSNLENIGDTIEKDLMDHAFKKIQRALTFSEAGRRDIMELYEKVMDYYQLMTSAVPEFNKGIAGEVIRMKEELYRFTYTLVDRHIERLKMGLKESVDTSSVHLDVVSNYRRIISFIADCATAIMHVE